MIKAYLITSSLPDSLMNDARSHLKKIADRYHLPLTDLKIAEFKISLVGNLQTQEVSNDNQRLFINISATQEITSDRFLKISIYGRNLTIESDYAGSIPCFYSSRKGFAASNIEPCVYIASNSSLEDICVENIYGFLKFSHFIWDETAWQHINQVLPDSKYIFDLTNNKIQKNYLATVKASSKRANLSDKKVALELFALNESLVTRSLSHSDTIILPLSSGYDSRMIFSVLANSPILAKRTRCFTYGPEGSIEVEAGRRLCNLKNIYWQRIDLPCNFLDKRYLTEVADVFGASMHMHGMYQIEFFEQLRLTLKLPPNFVITSGFMTGVPAGQHNGLLKINDNNQSLVHAMNEFSQSKTWGESQLNKLPVFGKSDYLEIAELRFREAFNRFEGEAYQKAVMFDVWTRQRNFISYYPRTLEWYGQVISPHMSIEYPNFFMSLSREHLFNRKAIELMFTKYYSDISSVGSNSNGLGAIGNRFESALFFISRLVNKLGIPNPMPKYYKNLPIDFDTEAIKKSSTDAFYPLLNNEEKLHNFIALFGGRDVLLDSFTRALGGDVKAYAQVVAIQSIAFNVLLN
jgi:hypothetical protein